MKKIILLLFIFIAVINSFSQSSKDSSDIHTAVLNYSEGWYEGNADRMAKAIHPKLAKRIIGWSNDHTKNENVLVEMDGQELVNRTRKRIGKNTPKEQQLINITILTIYNNSACVKVEMADWIDFMHLGRWNGEWKIINVLWEMKPQE